MGLWRFDGKYCLMIAIVFGDYCFSGFGDGLIIYMFYAICFYIFNERSQR